MSKRLRILTEDGLPIDAKAWTAADWQDLHEAIEKVKANVKARHQNAGEPVPPSEVHRGDRRRT